MTDTPDQPLANGDAAPQPIRITQRILGQFVRDLSFENNLAKKGVQVTDTTPETQVQVALDGKRRGTSNQYEVGMRLTVTSRAKATQDVLFLLEIDYVGVFQIDGLPEDQMHPYLIVECPRLMFPFVRRIVSDVTRDGGFPPLNLDIIDFVALYRAELARRQQAQGAAAPQVRFDA